MDTEQTKLPAQLREAKLFPLSLNKTPAVAKGQSWKDWSGELAPSQKTIGVDCGASGLVVLDVDRGHKEGVDGIEALATWVADLGVELPETLTVQTTSGGLHYYFLAAPGVTITNKTGSMPKDVGDVRGAGGFVVAPGSIAYKKVDGKETKTTGAYTVVNDAPIAPLPTWLALQLSSAPVAEKTPHVEVDYSALSTELERWEQGKLDEALGELRALQPGGRHGEIFRIASRIGWTLGEHRQATVLPLVVQAAQESGHAKACAADDAANGFRKGAETYQPLEKSSGGSTASAPPSTFTKASGGDGKSSTAATLTDEEKKVSAEAKREWRTYYSDMKLAERFIASGHDVLWVSHPKAGWTEWRSYDPATGVWKRVQEPEVRGLIQHFLEDEFAEAQASGDFIRQDLAEVCTRALTAKRVLDWMTPSLSASADIFDKHKDLLVVGNGVTDLRSSELKPFSPKYYATRRTPYPYIAGAQCDLLDEALEALPEDTRRQVQIMSGQALTGHQPSESTIFFLYGDGANGKSTFLELLAESAGTYGGNPPKKVLLKNSSDSNFHSIAFKGLRQAIIEELPDEKFLDGGVVRDLAGTRTMTGEHKGRDVEEFEVQATIFVSFNNRPQVTETAHGVWRRLRLITFPFTYVKKDEVTSALHRVKNPAIKDLAEKNEAAVIAFLAWRIEGARTWYEAGKTDPQDASSVVADTRAWRSTNDALGSWFKDNLVVDKDSFCLVDDLLDDFNEWRNSPRTAWARHSLTDKLTAHSLFIEHGLEYRQRARHGALTHSEWAKPAAISAAKRQKRIEQARGDMGATVYDLVDKRVAPQQATFIQGVRFRDQLNPVVPNDLSAIDGLGDDVMDLVDDDEYGLLDSDDLDRDHS